MRLSISSSAFHEGDKIPRKYTCEGEDVSPELAWNKPPEDTMSLYPGRRSRCPWWRVYPLDSI